MKTFCYSFIMWLSLSQLPERGGLCQTPKNVKRNAGFIMTHPHARYVGFVG
jgi:hypothetical protein